MRLHVGAATGKLDVACFVCLASSILNCCLDTVTSRLMCLQTLGQRREFLRAISTHVRGRTRNVLFVGVRDMGNLCQLDWSHPHRCRQCISTLVRWGMASLVGEGILEVRRGVIFCYTFESERCLRARPIPILKTCAISPKVWQRMPMTSPAALRCVKWAQTVLLSSR